MLYLFSDSFSIRLSLRCYLVVMYGSLSVDIMI
uniref:Uncharacterized protein n=1 Tax=Anguilla anguilla TaxID=7936 RepID=A0A0E9SV93_ANGAN